MSDLEQQEHLVQKTKTAKSWDLRVDAWMVFVKSSTQAAHLMLNASNWLTTFDVTKVVVRPNDQILANLMKIARVMATQENATRDDVFRKAVAPLMPSASRSVTNPNAFRTDASYHRIVGRMQIAKRMESKGFARQEVAFLPMDVVPLLIASTSSKRLRSVVIRANVKKWNALRNSVKPTLIVSVPLALALNV